MRAGGRSEGRHLVVLGGCRGWKPPLLFMKPFRILAFLSLLVGCAFPHMAAFAAEEAASKPFFTSLGEEFDEPLNRMWRIYGSVSDGTDAVVEFGNEPAWFEWLPRKLMWSDEFIYRSGIYNRLVQVPMSENGYVWSWGNQPEWPTAPGAYHQENNAKYILGIYRTLMWTRDEGFLAVKDPRQVDHETIDVSYGMTVLEKVRLAMRYQLEELNGEDGLLVVDNDHNTGLPDGAPTNYWDNFPFGYKDGYINIYFYASLLAMAEIEQFAGENERAAEYRKLAVKTKEKYSRAFWDDEKRRFIGCIDVEGNRWDFGFTFLNLEALAYGLGSDAQGEAILSWLDGTRIVEGDTSQGEDIYHFGWAPRATTLDVAELGEPYWWKPIVIDGVPQITVHEGGSATFGEHLENGGAIFYTSHYDILARARHRSADHAWRRLGAIMDEFRIDELRRDPTNNVGANWKIGITGVFPESGLVPATFLYAFLGIDANLEGLNIRPDLPAGMAFGGVRNLSFGQGLYDVQVWSDRLEVTPTHEGSQRLQGVLGAMTPNVEYILSVRNLDDGELRKWEMRTDEKGDIAFDLQLAKGMKFSIGPAEEGL